jgi:branched-chain amino acid transport system substrate-binding protein
VIGNTHARRRAVGRALLALVLGTSVLVACGGDDSDDGGPAVAAGGQGDDSASGGVDQASDETATQLQELLGFDDQAADDCAGDEFRMGAVLALTGPGSFYGKTMSRGIDLAAAQIEAAGGPAFAVDYYDHKSGDPAAGQQAITELGENGVVAKLASYVDDLGAMLPGTAQYEMFTMDGGGGTSIFGQAQPFFWGTRAITPNDPLPGLFQYLKEVNPDATTVGLAGWDIGEPSNSQVKEVILQQIADAGYEHNGLYELTPVGSQDYSQVLPKIKANEPDILLVGMYGQDPGSFMNQAQTAGLDAQIIGFEFTPDGVNASKGTYDSVGFTFAYDYFDAGNPTNPLAKLFVDTFNEEYGEDPDFYAANYYEDTLAMWDLIRRVCADGGEITGPSLDAAMQANPEFASVYGGDDSGPGTFSMDTETHSVLQRPMGVFEYKDGAVTPLAYFDIDGENFTLAD